MKDITPVAVVTGASSGIGESIAEILARKKIPLVLVARNAAALETLASRLRESTGTTVKVFAADLSEYSSVDKLNHFLELESLEIEYLVNNAGFGDYGLYHESDWEKNRRMIDLNITALAHLTRVALEGMVRRRKGRVLNVASTAAFQPGPLMSVYYASKAFVLHFSEAVNNEVRDFGVTVTAFCPGPVRTNFQSAAAMEESRLVKGRRLPSADEVAADAVDAMMKGKAVRIQGLANRILAFTPRFAPRAFAVRIARLVQEQKR
jgi:short-subunit dehydrogenase